MISPFLVPTRQAPAVDILSPDQAHQFAEEERGRATALDALAGHLEARARGLRTRAEQKRGMAERWDAAARGEWDDA